MRYDTYALRGESDWILENTAIRTRIISIQLEGNFRRACQTFLKSIRLLFGVRRPLEAVRDDRRSLGEPEKARKQSSLPELLPFVMQSPPRRGGGVPLLELFCAGSRASAPATRESQ